MPKPDHTPISSADDDGDARNQIEKRDSRSMITREQYPVNVIRYAAKLDTKNAVHCEQGVERARGKVNSAIGRLKP